MAKSGFYKRIFYSVFMVTGISFFASVGYGGTLFILENRITFPIQLIAGLVFCFTVLIIAHELLHGIAYKLVGAKKVYFGAILSQFVFYAGSDGENFSGREFRFIALFPFAVVFLLGAISLILFPEYFLGILTILFLHTLFCSGDFAVVNFMQQYDLNQIITFDSREKGETYFYQK